jgi:hypothetical protein
MNHPLHLKGNCLFIDNSTLSELSACPRRGMYKFLDKRQLCKSRAALFFGGAIHKALEVRDKMQKPLADNSVREAMHTALIEYYADVDFENDFRSLDYAIRTVDKYNETYKFDPLPPITLPTGELAVELPFAIPIGELHIGEEILVCDPDENSGAPFFKHIDILSIIFTGKIDRIVRDKGTLMNFDHKTSSMGGPNFFNEFYTAMQFRGYKHAAEQLTGEPIHGVIINGIICRPPTKDGRVNYDMDRHTIHIADSMVEEWQNSFLISVKEWINYVIDQKHYSTSPEQAFPLRTGSCIGKYGTCEFFDVCQLPPAQRGMMLASPLFEDHSWSPLDDPAKPKEPKAPLELGSLLDHLL